MMTTQPTLYISHGSPMLALAPGQVGERLAEVAASLPRPRAIVIASAHWLARRPLVGAHALPPTIHDFGGFPAALHAMRYPAPGDPALANEVLSRLATAGIEATLDPARGLDHGVWVALQLLYPAADIPVVPVSIQPNGGPAHQYALGQALATLRHENILVVGSGSITHNLGEIFGPGASVEPQAYVREFTDWIAQQVAANDVEALLDYRRRAPHAERANPTDEHLLPLFFALGAAGKQFTGQRIEAGIDYGVLAMDIFRFD
jgi:4,5-DOPA dioxygenase extradiol